MTFHPDTLHFTLCHFTLHHLGLNFVGWNVIGYLIKQHFVVVYEIKVPLLYRFKNMDNKICSRKLDKIFGAFLLLGSPLGLVLCISHEYHMDVTCISDARFVVYLICMWHPCDTRVICKRPGPIFCNNNKLFVQKKLQYFLELCSTYLPVVVVLPEKNSCPND